MPRCWARQQVTYDGDDNRTGELVSQVQPGGGTKMGTGTFAYDRLGRLVQAKHPLEAASADTYVLDDAGNIVNDGKAAYTYSHNRLRTPWDATDLAAPANNLATVASTDQGGQRA